MNQSTLTILDLIRDSLLDAELAALLWLLGEGGVPIHVAAPDAGGRAAFGAALRVLARDPAGLTDGPGAALEDVFRQPVPLRPATGVVLILDDGGRVVAAHLQRPPLRDGAGHVRPQGPAVLATWDPRLGAWEHFAWGVTPELADAAGRRAGDFEIEQERRREYLAGLAAAGLKAPDEVAAALVGYASPQTPH